MGRIFCPGCRLEQPVDHRFCARCGRALPTHLVEERTGKSASFFAGIKVVDDDPEQGFLRISCYLKDQHFAHGDADMTIPGHHVRFSMWADDTAKCVMSLPLAEAKRVADFLRDELSGIDDSLVAEIR